MSKERSKKEPHERCNACDFQKLKQLENNPVIRRLRDKIEQMNFRLTACRNENQMLKRNLQLAKKMVCQEVGGQDVDFQDLLKHGTESGSKGRQENVLVLKTRVQELKDYLRELEGELPRAQEATTSEEFVKHQVTSDRKKLWRMELERRLARENAEKDINPLVQECLDLRRSLDAEKSRYRELNEQVKILRAELQSQVEKNEEDFGILKSFKTLKKQLEETLAERAEIRQHLDGSRARNKRLTDEIISLKEELQVLQKKTNDSSILIDSLTNSHKGIQEATDFEKMIVEQTAERYKEELKILQDNQATDFEILDHLQCIIHDRNDIIDELCKDLNSREDESGTEKKAKNMKKANEKNSKDKEQDASTNKKSDEGKTDLEKPEEDENKTDSDEEIRKLKLECVKYKALCEGAKMEGDRLSQLIAHQDRKMNEIAVQVVETGRIIMQKNAEKKELLEKVNKLQKSLSTKRRRGKFLTPSKSRIDELRIKCDAQKEENNFLRNFLRSAVCSKAKELEKLRAFIADNKQFFDASLKEIKQLFEPESQTQEDSLPSTNDE